jgi:prefoldin subunit 5
MIMTVTTMTSKPRRQLSDQLDRLDEQLQRHDAILDALAEGLNGAVAEATQAGTREAVKAAVVELLTNPDLRTALYKASAPAAEAKPTAWERLKAKIRQAGERVAAVTRAARQAVAAKASEAKAVLVGAAAPAWVAWKLRKAALIGLGIGVVVAGIAYAGGHGLAATLSGVGAAVSTVAVAVVAKVRSAFRRLALA